MTANTMTETTAAPRDDRAAVDKAISLLVSFGDDSADGVGVSELARRAGLSKSTAHRVLGILERNGVVERLGTAYRIGTRLHVLAATVYAPGQEELRDLLIPHVTDLYEMTHETVHLAALYGGDVVYLAKLYGHQHLPSPSRIGKRIPAHTTAVGKALLAHCPSGAARILSGPLRGFTENTVTDPEVLSRQLDRARRDGVAVEHGEIQRGLCCIAVPVFDPHGRAVAALSVSGPDGRLDLRRQERALRTVAATASRDVARRTAQVARLRAAARRAAAG